MSNPYAGIAVLEQPEKSAPLDAKNAASILRNVSTKFERDISKMPTERQVFARDRFLSDPRIKNLQKVAAGEPVPVSTRKKDVQAVARSNLEKRKQKSAFTGTFLEPVMDASAAMSAGFENFLGIGPRAQAALGNGNLETAREENRQEQARSPVAAIIGGLAPWVSGGGPGSLVSGAGERIGANVLGRTLVGSQTLRKGQTVRNVLKLAGGGAAGGAAQAAGEGSDVKTSAAYGAAIPAGVYGGAKLGKFLGTRVADIVGASSLPSIMRRFTSMSVDELRAAAARFRADTGAEPTVAELLPANDRHALDRLLGRSANTREAAARGIQARAANIGPEMQDSTRAATGAGRTGITNQIEADLAASRGAPDAADPATAARAADQPLDMDALAHTEAANIMAPHENARLFDGVDDLVPQAPVLQADGSVAMIPNNPEVASAIRSAAGTLRLRPDGEGITGREITQILSKLRGNAARGGIEGDNAQAAINHLEDLLAAEHPQVAGDVARMRDAYAARSRMGEGMAEGGRTRVRADVPAGSDRAALDARNAYDSAEGTSGRQLGQTNRLVGQFGEGPQAALRSTEDVANNPNTQAALAGNLGAGPAEDIARAAAAQTQSAEALASFSNRVDSEGSAAGDAAIMLAGMNPSSMVITKLRAFQTVMKVTRLPEAKAHALVEMLFSQNPALVQRATNMLNTVPQGGEVLRGLMGAAAGSGALNAQDGGEPEVAALAAIPDAEAVEVPEVDAGGYSDFASEAPETLNAGDVVQSIFPGVQVTEVERDPNSELGRKNPGSTHIGATNTVDVRPIPDMSFEEFIKGIEDAGYDIVYKRDEVSDPSGHATGPHWHVQIR